MLDRALRVVTISSCLHSIVYTLELDQSSSELKRFVDYNCLGGLHSATFSCRFVVMNSPSYLVSWSDEEELERGYRTPSDDEEEEERVVARLAALAAQQEKKNKSAKVAKIKSSSTPSRHMPRVASEEAKNDVIAQDEAGWDVPNKRQRSKKPPKRCYFFDQCGNKPMEAPSGGYLLYCQKCWDLNKQWRGPMCIACGEWHTRLSASAGGKYLPLCKWCIKKGEKSSDEFNFGPVRTTSHGAVVAAAAVVVDRKQTQEQD